MLFCESFYVRGMKLRLLIALCLFSVNCVIAQSVWSSFHIVKNQKNRNNGTNEVFNSGVDVKQIMSNDFIVDTVPPRVITSSELRVLDSIKGKNDAIKFYYVDELEVYVTGGVTIFFSPLIGVIPAVIFSRRTIPDYKLNIQNEELKNNSNYFNSYVRQARKIKKKNIWESGWAIPSILWAAAGAILVVPGIINPQ